jgi:EmrB/QacA subfamily drug resistance transporter
VSLKAPGLDSSAPANSGVEDKLAHSASAPCAPASAPWLLAAVILASSMAFIDGTVVNVALPALQSSLGASFADIQWVVQAYALLLAALLIVGGAAGDRFGRKRVFSIGVALFALASLACGLAQGVEQLIAARALQGVGAALLVPGSLAIITAAFSERERGRAIGIWSGATAITAALGPVLGGWLIDHFSWRAAFFINLPLAAAVLVLTFRHVPESRDEEVRGPIDWAGAALVTIGLCALVFGLTETQNRGFRDAAVVASLLVGAAALAAFVAVEARRAAPMIPLGLFRSATFSGANLLTLLLYAALGGALFFLPLNLVQLQGYSMTAAGAALLPFILLMFLLSPWAGGLVRRHGARLPLMIGPLIAAGGFALFALPGVGGGYWSNVFPAVVALGLGMSVAVAPLTTAVMEALPPAHSGLASAINNAASRVGSLLSIALFGIVMAASFNASLEDALQREHLSEPAALAMREQRAQLAAIKLPDVPQQEAAAAREVIGQAFLTGYRRVMLLSALLAAASALCAWAFIRKPAGS